MSAKGHEADYHFQKKKKKKPTTQKTKGKKNKKKKKKKEKTQNKKKKKVAEDGARQKGLKGSGVSPIGPHLTRTEQKGQQVAECLGKWNQVRARNRGIGVGPSKPGARKLTGLSEWKQSEERLIS